MPAEGYEFDYWSGDVPSGLENDNTIEITMDSDKSVTAHFLRVASYTLIVSVDPAAGGSVTLDPPGSSYPEGTVVTLTAVPAENYGFAGWSGDAS
ncbi:MAG TPA: cell wall-binding protein, partial [Hadesarchaea archaeon]|nr:cell wall-binding protein [Hadesarchaea archaeon]